MPTVVDLSEQEIAQLKSLTNQSDAAAAVRVAMDEYVRLARRRQLRALSGQITMEDNWRSLEANELRDQGDSAGTGPH